MSKSKRRKTNHLETYEAPMASSSSEDVRLQAGVTEWNIRSSGVSTSRTSVTISTAPAELLPKLPQPMLLPEVPAATTSSIPEVLTDSEPSVIQIVDNAGKRSHAASLNQWKREIPLYLDEILRLDGRGDACNRLKCSGCAGSDAYFRCTDCTFGDELYCQNCLVQLHSRNPLHSVEIWSEDQFFQHVTLKSLGLKIQLGHAPGSECILPKSPKGDSFVIISETGIHDVSIRFCGCQTAGSLFQQLMQARLYPATISEPATAATFSLLNFFQILGFEANISVHNFHATLSRLTDNTGLADIKDRAEEIRRMIREWRHLMLLKRSGRAHDPAGIDATKPGECAVECPACPQPGRNLPNNWEEALPNQKWIYTLFLGMDANFKLCRRNVSSEEQDPSLSKGYGYFVDEAEYRRYLSQTDGVPQAASTCVSHDAVNKADTKDTRGLAATGMGAVDCIRHEFKRPCSVGDLHRGERFLNMDFFVYWSLVATLISWIILSYDIMCQYSVHFRKRMSKNFPMEWSVNNGQTSIRYLIPKFHLPAHILRCGREFSFNFTKWCGRTDGEGPERRWSALNALAGSTKEMGPGSRRDTLDDHMGDGNWKKIVKLGYTLISKIHVAIPEVRDHRVALQDLEAILRRDSSEHTDGELIDQNVIQTWTAEVEAWEDNPTENQNPFEPRITAPTQNQIRLQLATEESAELEAEKDRPMLHHSISPAAMIGLGLELENLQRKLHADISSLGQHSTNLQRAKLLERSNSLLRRIRSWFEIQALYIPGTVMLREHEALASNANKDLQAFAVQLWLPSEIGHLVPCSTTLFVIEWRLRKAQANDALAEMRSNLRYNSFLVKRKRSWSQGVSSNTRSQKTIMKSWAKVTMHALRYQTARNALINLENFIPDGPLKPELMWSHFQDLKDTDIRGLPIDDIRIGEGHVRLSWIWLTSDSGMDERNQQGLTDALRVQWLRLRSRRNRWEEEVALVSEEMRRVLQFLEWQGNWWLQQQTRRVFRDPAVAEGYSAYARKQATLKVSLRRQFAYLWRDAGTWIQTGEVPSGRRWYSTTVQPQNAPSSPFDQACTPQSSPGSK